MIGKRIIALAVGLCAAEGVQATTWLPVGHNSQERECYFLNVERLAGDSYAKRDREAIAWIKTTSPDTDVSLVELIRFQCATNHYSLIRRYRRTADGKYHRPTSTHRDGTTQRGSPASGILGNVCKQVEHIAVSLAAGQSTPTPLHIEEYPSCQR